MRITLPSTLQIETKGHQHRDDGLSETKCDKYTLTNMLSTTYQKMLLKIIRYCIIHIYAGSLN